MTLSVMAAKAFTSRALCIACAERDIRCMSYCFGSETLFSCVGLRHSSCLHQSLAALSASRSQERP